MARAPVPSGRSARDVQRYKERLERAIKDQLPQVVANEDILSARPGQHYRVRVPILDEPRFRPARPGGAGDGRGSGQAGDESADYTIEVEITLEELADWLFESLNLPDLKPKQSSTEVDRVCIEGVSRRGPYARLDKKRTLVETIKSGGLREEALRYRDVRMRERPLAQAVVTFVRDISASMDDEKRFLVRSASFWLLQWVRRAYPRTECVFIVHDSAASEVDEREFFQIERAGGTLISSGLNLAHSVLETRYPRHRFNRYIACFSDGDTFSPDEEPACDLAIQLAQSSECFAYGETHPSSTQSPFLRRLRGRTLPDNLRAALICRREDVAGWLQHVFGKEVA